MHYIFLKNILESVLANFTCPQCHNKTNEQSIQVTGISSHGIDIHIHCHICSTHSQLNAEINTIAGQMLQNENGKKFLEEFLKNGGTIGANMESMETANIGSEKGIKSEDIDKLNENLKNAKSIEDFMN